MRGKLGLFMVGLALMVVAAGLVSAVGGSDLALIIGGLGALCMISVRFVGSGKSR